MLVLEDEPILLEQLPSSLVGPNPIDVHIIFTQRNGQ